MPDGKPVVSEMHHEPHHEVSEIFADGLGALHFDGNIFRVDLAVVRWKETVSGPVGEQHICARLVLTPKCAKDLAFQLTRAAAGYARSREKPATPTH
jgi:hypothetical protein